MPSAIVLLMILALRERGLSLITRSLGGNEANAKAYRTGKSAFAGIGNSKGFVMIALAIIVGQVLITTFGGAMFSVTPLKITDWLIIIGATSTVLWVGEALRMIVRK